MGPYGFELPPDLVASCCDDSCECSGQKFGGMPNCGVCSVDKRTVYLALTPYDSLSGRRYDPKTLSRYDIQLPTLLLFGDCDTTNK